MQDNQSQAHWIYAAAIMDSDGCFMICRYKRGKRFDYLPNVKIAMINDGSINYIHQETGLGYISVSGVRPSRPNSLPLFEWRITNRADLMKFLEGIIPYCRNKRDRAEFLFEYCKNIGHKPHGQRHIAMTKEELEYRESSYQNMKELNRIKAGTTTKPRGSVRICDSLNS